MRKMSRVRVVTIVLSILAAVAIGAGVHTEFAGTALPKSTVTPRYGSAVVHPGQSHTIVVGCKPGETAIGGGHRVAGGNFVFVLQSSPTREEVGYAVSILVPDRRAAPTVLSASLTVKALCATKGQPVVP